MIITTPFIVRGGILCRKPERGNAPVPVFRLPDCTIVQLYYNILKFGYMCLTNFHGDSHTPGRESGKQARPGNLPEALGTKSINYLRIDKADMKQILIIYN